MNFHGGNIYEHKEKLLDFSSNINPFGVPKSFRRALMENMEEFTKYPDIQYQQLKKDIAEYLGIYNLKWIVPGNGAVELLYKAIQASGKRRVLALRPTFSEYARAAGQHGIEYLAIDAFDSEFREVDVELLAEKADQETAVIICNPNNPTGTLTEKCRLLWLAERLKSKNALLIMDEAFMEFTDDCKNSSMLDCLERYSNLIVVKAATKFFGMPGIRLGYAVSSNEGLTGKIAESMEPWNINTSAVIASSVIFKDGSYINKSRNWIREERPYMYEKLSAIAGLHAYPSQSNFYLLRLHNKSLDAWTLRDELIKRGILIRTPEGFEGLDGSFVRVAVKDRTSNNCLLQALEEIFSRY